MEPRFLRTPLYQELLLAAIEYEKRRGITKTFIWACPPMAGDDYILYCHPREQKTQKVDMLRAWYWRLLEDARKRGIVCSVDNLYDGYLRRLCSLPGVPNFEGDYWPGLAEQHIMDLEKSGADPKGLAPRAQRAIMRSRTTADGTMLAPPKSKKSRSATKKKSKTKSKSRSRSNTMASTGPVQKRKSEGVGANGDTSTAQPPQSGEGNSLWPPPPPAKWVEMPQQDTLTAKIGDCIRQMKEDFFVVHLYHLCAECNESMDKTDQLYWLPKAYTEGMGSLDVQKKRYAPPYALCDPCYRKAYEAEHGGSPEHVTLPPTLDEKKKQEAQEAAKEAAKEAKLKVETREGAPASLKRVAGQSESGVKRSKSSSSEDAAAAAAARPDPTAPGSAPPSASSLSDAGPKSLIKSEPGTAQNVTVKEEEEKEESLGGAASTAIPQINESATPSTAADGSEGAEDHEMSEKGRVLETEERILPAGQSAKPQNPWVNRPCELDEMALHRAYVERETRDPDPLMDNQFFDNRNQFLSLCQSNNYQFDQLRRAKHSSMMVLYHLHNPDQPAFPRVCSACAQEIKDADWFTCRTCDAYDVCAECHKTVKHEHPLHKRSPESEAKYLADQQARRAQITAYLNLLKHACTCNSPNCSQTKCAQMKVGLDHWNSCRVQAPQVCAQCQNIKKLINLHTLHCREPPGRCPVPRCNRIKQETRRMQAVQADRRIKARMAAKRANLNGSPPPASTPPQVPTV